MVALPPIIAQHKAGAAVAGGGVLAGLYVMHKRRQSTLATAEVPATATDTATDTTDASGDYSDTGSYGDYSSASGQAYGNNGSAYLPSYGDTATSTTPTTNAQWFAAAETALMGVGYDPVTVTAALGKYLAGSASVSASELQIIQAAWGFVGKPPTPVANPTVGAATAAGVTAKDGYYRLITNGAIFQVKGGQRFSIHVNTWKAINAQKVKPVVTPILPNNAVMKLPSGGFI